MAGLMSTVFMKLNLKGQSEILVIDAPESFEAEAPGLTDITADRDLGATSEVASVLTLVTTQRGLEKVAAASRDPIVWSREALSFSR